MTLFSFSKGVNILMVNILSNKDVENIYIGLDSVHMLFEFIEFFSSLMLLALSQLNKIFFLFFLIVLLSLLLEQPVLLKSPHSTLSHVWTDGILIIFNINIPVLPAIVPSFVSLLFVCCTHVLSVMMYFDCKSFFTYYLLHLCIQQKHKGNLSNHWAQNRPH